MKRKRQIVTKEGKPYDHRWWEWLAGDRIKEEEAMNQAKWMMQHYSCKTPEEFARRQAGPYEMYKEPE